jgi:hypothetical protein
VIDTAAAELAGRQRARGAVGTTVVVAGSVITRQPRRARALAARLQREHPELELRILAGEPVAGAVALARWMLGAPVVRVQTRNQ